MCLCATKIDLYCLRFHLFRVQYGLLNYTGDKSER